jgi:hypothetical protein
MFKRKLGVLAFCLVSLAASSALAQPVDDATRGAARKIGYSGVEAYQAGNYPTANEKLEKAYRVLRVPSLGLWSARALAKVGKLVEASERYLEVTRLTVSGGDEAVQKQAQGEAQTELDALSPKIPNLIVQLEGASAAEVKVTIDGVVVASDLIGEARPVNPGRHKVEGQRGAQNAVVEATVAEGEQKPVVLRFAGQPGAAPIAGAAPAPAAQAASSDADVAAKPGSGRRTLGYIAVGVGAAGVVLGGVTGMMALAKYSEFEKNPNCLNDQCLASEQDKVDGYKSLRTISTIGFVGGGVLAAIGIVLVTTAPKDQQPSAALWVGPSSAGLSGRF